MSIDMEARLHRMLIERLTARAEETEAKVAELRRLARSLDTD